MTRVLFYTLYERIWHWAQAFGIILLLLTGFQLHYADKFPLFGSLTNAVMLHGIIGFVLLLNAFLGLFYTLTNSKIKHYIPMPQDFMRGMFEQAKYYLWGIFQGDPHPFEKTPDKKLNPLQKITYFFLLNLLLPFQMVTGVLLWAVYVTPDVIENMGGLKVLAPLHTLGAFLFLSFLVVHIYLTTTGHTPLDYIIQMITGYGTVEDKD